MADTVDLNDLMDLDDIVDEQEMSEAMAKAKTEQAAIMEQFEKRKKLRSIAVPTDDTKVRAKLRELGHPITLFGEGPAERRDRLRHLISQMDGVTVTFDDESDSEGEEEEVYWTAGTDELLHARQWMANYSLRRARRRIARQRIEFDTPMSVYKSLRRDLYADLKTWTPVASQIVDERPTSYVSFAPNSQTLASGSFSGAIKLWSVPHCKPLGELRAHRDRIGGIAWHPRATVGQSESACNLASGGADHAVHLWSLDGRETPLASLVGHTDRVSRIAFHPSGRFLATTSFDQTWRLWDVETGASLLEQDGHARQVYCIAAHPDGSLVATGGLDGLGKLWDLRTGRNVLNLQGHLRQVLAADFHPVSGYHLATGSEDNTIKVWDLRAVRCAHTIPAHTSLVSQVKYFAAARLPTAARDLRGPNAGKYTRGCAGTSGMFLVSGGFDGVVSIWSDSDYKPLKALKGHAGKVMGIDVSPDAEYLVSAGYDRTFKLWGGSAQPATEDAAAA
ncbi:hypothetical protein H9P43_004155 [Blastocladiella emersonii ATCC 22665]|nr:hypothetical protein H9P43_004155 [Blastocladiella emersonii ATCC 22665]